MKNDQYFSSPGLSKRMRPLEEKRKVMAAKKETQIVGTATSEVVDLVANESEITCSEVMHKCANELFESAQNNMQNDVQNSAKTTKNALLQNADNERVATCSLEEERKVEKDKGKYGCCGTTTARVTTSTTTNNCQVSILPFLVCHKKERSKVPTSKLLVSAYFHDDCSYERFNLLRSSSISCLMLRPPPSADLRHKSFALAG